MNRQGDRSEAALALAVARIPGLGWRQKTALMGSLGGVEELRAIHPGELRARTGRSVPREKWRPEEWAAGAERDLVWLDQSEENGVVWRGCRDYPELLSSLSHTRPPFLLYYRGRLSGLSRRTAAVVGTRTPSRMGRQGAYRMGAELAARGWTVVSGLARGVDGAAHAGCRDAGGITAAVLGSGPDRIYPGEHRRLAGRILEQEGILLSEFCPGERPAAWHFPARNRIISGLSEAVLVAEAPRRSGALITADFALDQGRELAVLQDGLMTGAAQGMRALEAEGAAVVRSAGQLAALTDGYPWQIEGDDEEDPPEEQRPGAGDERRAFAEGPDRIGRAAAEALMAEMAGRRFRFAGGWFERG